MMIVMAQVNVYGARGSTPVCGPEFVRYGGQTTCFGVETGDQLVVIDAGSGLSDVSTLLQQRSGSIEMTILMTHYHMDHMLGLYTLPLRHRQDCRISIVSCSQTHGDFRKRLEAAIGAPYWPTPLAESVAEINYHDLSTSDGELRHTGLRITARPIPHPQNCLAYRIDADDGSVVIATDLEFTDRASEDDLESFCANTNLLIFDAQFTPEEYESVRGWGHSTWEHAARFAGDCGAEKLVLTHHDPGRTDAQIDEIVTETRTIFAETEAAAAGMVLPLKG